MHNCFSCAIRQKQREGNPLGMCSSLWVLLCLGMAQGPCSALSWGGCGAVGSEHSQGSPWLFCLSKFQQLP